MSILVAGNPAQSLEAPARNLGEASLSDAEVELLANAALRGSGYLAIRLLACKFAAGVLMLKGRVPSFYMKQLASLAVAHIEDVERVDNQVEVA